MKKLLLSSVVLAALSSIAIAAPTDSSTRASAEWNVTADKDGSHALEITPVQANATISYNPVTKKFEEKALDFNVRMLSSSDYTVTAYNVKASSSQNELKHTTSIATAAFDLSIVDTTGKKMVLTETPQDLTGLKGFGDFADAAAIAGEFKGVSQLTATFTGGKDTAGQPVTDASKLMDGQYAGKFDLILDASWKKKAIGGGKSASVDPDPETRK